MNHYYLHSTGWISNRFWKIVCEDEQTTLHITWLQTLWSATMVGAYGHIYWIWVGRAKIVWYIHSKSEIDACIYLCKLMRIFFSFSAVLRFLNIPLLLGNTMGIDRKHPRILCHFRVELYFWWGIIDAIILASRPTWCGGIDISSLLNQLANQGLVFWLIKSVAGGYMSENTTNCVQ